MSNQSVSVFGYACGIGARDTGTRDGPRAIAAFLPTQMNPPEYFHPSQDCQGLEALRTLAEINQQLAERTLQQVLAHQRFLTLGGDHSCAIGSWSGAAKALQEKGPLGLIWFDAHMDSHTPETTPSKNIHGMPVACLLGFGDPSLTQILTRAAKVRPENLCLIGVRSFESEEQDLLERLNVRVFYMDEIKARGLEVVLYEALLIATQNTVGFGISFDLDAMDPVDAPGVGSPAPDGLRATPLLHALQAWQNHPQLVGLEIAEYNPHLDIDGRTQQFAVALINTLFNFTSQG